MGPVTRLYLDTNIFIELGEGGGEQQSLLLEIIGKQMAEDATFLCTSEFTLAELLVVPYRDRDDALIQLYDNWILQGNTWLDVGPVTREVLWSAALVRRRYSSIKMPDAIHVSTAIGFQCSHLLTADKQLPKSIQIVNDRWNLFRSSQTLSIIQPTRDVLESIRDSRA